MSRGGSASAFVSPFVSGAIIPGSAAHVKADAAFAPRSRPIRLKCRLRTNATLASSMEPADSVISRPSAEIAHVRTAVKPLFPTVIPAKAGIHH
jgi:hypothetical protein